MTFSFLFTEYDCCCARYYSCVCVSAGAFSVDVCSSSFVSSNMSPRRRRACLRTPNRLFFFLLFSFSSLSILAAQNVCPATENDSLSRSVRPSVIEDDSSAWQPKVTPRCRSRLSHLHDRQNMEIVRFQIVYSFERSVLSLRARTAPVRCDYVTNALREDLSSVVLPSPNRDPRHTSQLTGTCENNRERSSFASWFTANG